MNEIAKTEYQPLDQQAVLRTIDLKQLRQLIAGELDKITEDFDGPSGLVEQAGRVPTDIATWTKQTFSATGDLRHMIKARLRMAEDLRVLCVKPINDGVKDINKLFKDRTAVANEADTNVSKLRVKWEKAEEARVRAEQERVRKEAEEKALAEAKKLEEAAQAARMAEEQAKAAGNAEAAKLAAETAKDAEQAVDEVLEQPSQTRDFDPTVRGVRGLHGSVGGARKTWKAKLVNLRALPDVCVEAIMANDKAVDIIRIALKEFIEPRLDILREGGKPDALPGIVFEQVTSDHVR